MVKVIKRFRCGTCGEEYNTYEEAKKCELRETMSPIYKVGDILTITSGDGAGKRASVTDVFWYTPSWHYKFAHHVGYIATILDEEGGSRQLIQGYDCI